MNISQRTYTVLWRSVHQKIIVITFNQIMNILYFKKHDIIVNEWSYILTENLLDYNMINGYEK